MYRPGIILLILTFPADLSFAQTVLYDGTTFPEEAGIGWIHLENESNPAERSLDAGGGGWLVQSPVIIPCPPECKTCSTDCETQDFYNRELVDHAGMHRWFLTWVVTTDGPADFGSSAPAAIVAGGNDGVHYHFTMAKDSVQFDHNIAPLQTYFELTPGTHTFSLELDNTPPVATYRFKIDGAVVVSGLGGRFYPKADSVVVFGARSSIKDSVTKWGVIEFGNMDKQEVPTLSTWSVAVMISLLLTAGTIVFRSFKPRYQLEIRTPNS